MAETTLKILGLCVTSSKSPDEIETQLLSTIRKLRAALPYDVIVCNYCNHIIDILNDELSNAITFTFTDIDQSEMKRSKSLSLLEMFSSPTAFSSFDSPLAGNQTGEMVRSQSESSELPLKRVLKQTIDDMIENIPAVHKKIASYSLDFIHEGDILMTFGVSQSVRSFFKQASLKRHFHVLIPERAPYYDGDVMAKMLREDGILCTVIPDSAVFAVMPRITAVFAPVRSIFADGTIVTSSFTRTVAMAAKHHAKPFVMLYWKWKLTERFLRPGDSFAELKSPADIINVNTEIGRTTTILNPEGEVLPASLVTLFINEYGPHDAADIFQLVQDMYHRTD